MSNKPEVISIDGVDYVRRDTAQTESGELSLVVLHRGWIFVGVWDDESGVISQCHNVRHFSKVGFGGLSQGAKYANAQLDKCRDVRVDPAALMFAVPLADGWHDA